MTRRLKQGSARRVFVGVYQSTTAGRIQDLLANLGSLTTWSQGLGEREEWETPMQFPSSSLPPSLSLLSPASSSHLLFSYIASKSTRTFLRTK